MHLNQWQRRAIDDLIRSIVNTREADRDAVDSTPVPADTSAPAGASPEAGQAKEAKLPNDTQGRPATMGDLMFGTQPTGDSVEQGKDGRDVAGGQ